MGKLNEKLNYQVYMWIAICTTAVVSVLMIVMTLIGSIKSLSIEVGVSTFESVILGFASIYLMYLQCETIHNLNMSCGLKENGETINKSKNFVVVGLLSLVTVGIYSLYWIYRQEARMIEAGKKYRINNTFESEEKKAFPCIIAGLICNLIGFFLMLAYVNSLKEHLVSYFFTGDLGWETITLLVMARIVMMGGVVLTSAGYLVFYHDVNILSAAFNRETKNGTLIVCEIHKGKDINGGGNGHVVPPTPKPMDGKVRMLSGQYAGSEIRLKPDERIVIGREPKQCDLICASEQVSRVHLSITYRIVGGKGEYFVKDMSTNGTISSKTGKLPKEQEVKQPVGAVLTLGKSSESIQLL